jgi:phospholipase/carboxylesterase
MTAPQLPTDDIMWSSQESERAGRPLIVLLHGYGSHEGDLFGMSPALPLGPVIASLRAPLQAGPGYAWWEINQLGAPDASEVDAAASMVLDWLDSFDHGAVTLLGFSQGGALSLQLLRHAPDRFAAAVCLAGFVVPGEHPGDAELARVRPPVFWGRGTDDPVIPDAAVELTERWLPQHADATIRIYEGLGHAVSTPELTDMVAFLRQHASPPAA